MFDPIQWKKFKKQRPAKNPKFDPINKSNENDKRKAKKKFKID